MSELNKYIAPLDEVKRAREACETIEYLKNKYPWLYLCNPRSLADALEINTRYDIPMRKFKDGCNGLYLDDNNSRGHFYFSMPNIERLKSLHTDDNYEFNTNEWYVVLKGCEFENLCKDRSHWFDKDFQDEWQNFNIIIKTYEPVAQSSKYGTYYFKMNDGYFLFCDFPMIYECEIDIFKKLVNKYEIERLKTKLKNLTEECNG